MARMARIDVPGCPHHVTHRGNLRSDIFWQTEDRLLYASLLAQTSQQFGLEIWAYCLMTDHVHLVCVPRDKESLGLAIGRAHQRYAAAVNARNGWTGHLWANRYFSTPLDQSHLWAAVKYVELNPVRAQMVKAAGEYQWSSAQSHAGLRTTDDLLSQGSPFPGPLGANWAQWLAEGIDEATLMKLRMATCTGRPCGNPLFVDRLEKEAGRPLAPQKRGRKPKAAEAASDVLTADLFVPE